MCGPLFLSELAPAHLRGAFNTQFQVNNDMLRSRTENFSVSGGDQLQASTSLSRGVCISNHPSSPYGCITCMSYEVQAVVAVIRRPCPDQRHKASVYVRHISKGQKMVTSSLAPHQASVHIATGLDKRSSAACAKRLELVCELRPATAQQHEEISSLIH